MDFWHKVMLDIQAVKSKVDLLLQPQALAQSEEPKTVFDPVVEKHTKKTAGQLSQIVNNDKDLNQDLIEAQLKKFLAQYWSQVQGTCVCYTAQPDSELTELLCFIASKLAESVIESDGLMYLCPGEEPSNFKAVKYPDDYGIRVERSGEEQKKK